ncbi:telomere repeat-binding protein 6 isoform X2 [Selaginella moellendorffii]|uniref:telomere repeat-binding protein 6 isoform X2 n=1 Tax=Selaginella moellendorffii TaxID=88036 RepID=UPI000D1CD71C|nr:telomere repeat-binding protein 6 isoform X2 [Selaginella moellendorffii]|eukprot:XP_024526370.1 telomere repeat-binding protein 6 isoform X2 [Selaginella moellendorffii]
MSSSDKESYSDLEGGMDQMLEDYEDVQSMGGEDCELDFSGEHVETVPTPNGGTRRKHHRPWTLREVMILVEGVARCGGGKWADIKKLEFSSVSYRTAVDLKDKWRNLLRASRVHFTSKQQQAEHNKKKHFAVSIPQPILARVRELAALQNQRTSMPVLTRTSRSGRTLRRK